LPRNPELNFDSAERFWSFWLGDWPNLRDIQRTIPSTHFNRIVSSPLLGTSGIVHQNADWHILIARQPRGQ
jgi:hypothetical protein